MLIQLQDYVNRFTAEANKTIFDEVQKIDRKNVIIAEKFRFGFGYFIDKTKQGPPSEQIRDVFIQKQVLEYLVTKLFEANPLSIIDISRTPVVADPSKIEKTLAGNVSTGLFIIDPLTSAQQPGAIATLGFRIKFSGYTNSLRALLLSLPEFPLPLVVRSVEVVTRTPIGAVERVIEEGEKEPINIFQDDDNARDLTQVLKGEPIVFDNVSVFTVIVELIRVQKETTPDPKDNEDGEAPS